MNPIGVWGRFALVILTGFLVVASGCADKAPSALSAEGVMADNNIQDAEGTVITLYYITRQGGYMVPVSQKLCTTDRPVRLTLGRLIGGPDADGDLISPIPPETRVRDLYIRDGTAYVDLSCKFISDMEADSRYARWAVETLVQTLSQFDDIDRVQILISGKVREKLAEDVEIGEPLEPKRWLNAPTDEPDGQMILLYFDYQGQYLVPISRYVGIPTESLSQMAIEELIKGPQEMVALDPVVPDNVRILDYRVEQGTAYVDLDLGEAEKDADNWDESRALCSMLFTLMEFPHIQNVQLLVQGQIVGYLSGQVDLNNTCRSTEVNLMGTQRGGEG